MSVVDADGPRGPILARRPLVSSNAYRYAAYRPSSLHPNLRHPPENGVERRLCSRLNTVMSLLPGGTALSTGLAGSPFRHGAQHEDLLVTQLLFMPPAGFTIASYLLQQRPGFAQTVQVWLVLCSYPSVCRLTYNTARLASLGAAAFLCRGMTATLITAW
jgi:hypothetical protein